MKIGRSNELKLKFANLLKRRSVIGLNKYVSSTFGLSFLFVVRIIAILLQPYFRLIELKS